MPNDRNNKQNENQSTSNTPNSPSPFEAPKGQPLIEPPETEKPSTKADYKVNVTQPNRGTMVMQTWSPIILSVLTLIVIGVQVYIYKKMWDAMKIQTENTSRQTDIMKEQAEIMSKQMIISERAWVTISKSQFNGFKVGETITFEIIIANTGNTPALHVEVYVGKEFSNKSPLEPIPIIETPEGSISVIGAHDTAPLPIRIDEPLPQETFDRLNQQKIHFYFWGLIKYYDVFGQQHVTQFCFVNAKTPLMFSFCPNNNSVDG